MTGIPYKKDWIVSTRIARAMISMPLQARIPTISEYCGTFDCSRGVVQNALAALEQSGAITLSRRGKQGTHLLDKDEDKLFENAGLSFLTGSMPTPLNIHLSGLATGICQAMSVCKIPFTFAFIQGGRNRMDALKRNIYDFVVVTKAAAVHYIESNPQVEIAFPLADCQYSLPYYIYINQTYQTELRDGMSIAADPTSPDQWLLTGLLCRNKNVSIVEMPYIPTVQAFKVGKVDSVVLRGEHLDKASYENEVLLGQALFDTGSISAVPIELPEATDMQQPVVLVNKDNYGITGILQSYLGGQCVAHVQQKVLDRQMAPQFF